MLTDYQDTWVLEDVNSPTYGPISRFPVKQCSLIELAGATVAFYDEDYRSMQDWYERNGLVWARAVEERDTQKVIDLINSIDSYRDNDITIYTIISEEAQPFFAGASTAGQAAERIQQRASVYLSERR